MLGAVFGLASGEAAMEGEEGLGVVGWGGAVLVVFQAMLRCCDAAMEGRKGSRWSVGAGVVLIELQAGGDEELSGSRASLSARRRPVGIAGGDRR